MKTSLTQEQLKQHIQYNPETGVFTRLTYSAPNAPAGAIAGGINALGYRQIGVCGGSYLGHRLAWLYVRGDFPACEIDHVNGDRSDNRFVNLRLATKAENAQNISACGRGTSGLLGASYMKDRRKWRAYIHVGKKYKHLGTFDSKEAAHEAYLTAKAQLHEFSPTPREATA